MENSNGPVTLDNITLEGNDLLPKPWLALSILFDANLSKEEIEEELIKLENNISNYIFSSGYGRRGRTRKVSISFHWEETEDYNNNYQLEVQLGGSIKNPPPPPPPPIIKMVNLRYRENPKAEEVTLLGGSIKTPPVPKEPTNEVAFLSSAFGGSIKTPPPPQEPTV